MLVEIVAAYHIGIELLRKLNKPAQQLALAQRLAVQKHCAVATLKAELQDPVLLIPGIGKLIADVEP